MKQCKNCLEMYDHPHPTAGIGKFRFFGDYCPYCGSFNSDFDKYLKSHNYKFKSEANEYGGYTILKNKKL